MADAKNRVLDFLSQHEPMGEFAPYVEVSPEADALTVYFKPDRDYSVRLTDHVTLYRSLDTNDIVGCRIKGIEGLLADLPNYLRVNHDNVDLSFIFWSFRGGVDRAEVRDAFNELARSAGDLKVESVQ